MRRCRWRRSNHPNIVTIHSVEQDSDTHFGPGADIYLQSIGSRNALQITHDVDAFSPAFSSDGTQIAFSNFGVNGSGAIYVTGCTGDRLRRRLPRRASTGSKQAA